ncbi:hypothetical protein TW95_gp1539 [Pandoravirus inopinatum]|uniref:Uncharacterized protein n=1 Tax=Pandoravirus inopinatum TaxID=1605721 RepID=A0A0B5IZF4_9VIRU|nr:hypothetical protein TW95_gp1539 [Pandoravirus inopinatum]AJF98273.1 hypothetical protein [Pandoravirus inopinatum]
MGDPAPDVASCAHTYGPILAFLPPFSFFFLSFSLFVGVPSHWSCSLSSPLDWREHTVSLGMRRLLSPFCPCRHPQTGGCLSFSLALLWRRYGAAVTLCRPKVGTLAPPPKRYQDRKPKRDMKPKTQNQPYNNTQKKGEHSTVFWSAIVCIFFFS